MKHTGWIKLHRKLIESSYFKNSKYVHLWVYLLLLANHDEHNFMWNNKVILIKEGQLLTGRKELAEKTGINESTIEKILNFFEKEHQIEQQKTTKFRIITILNWKEYQQKEQQSNNRITTKEQQNNTYKNVKNVKNDKNNNNVSKMDTCETSAEVVANTFSFNSYLEEIALDKRRHIQIIALYWKWRGIKFDTKKLVQEALNRNCRPAKALVDYSNKEITDTMDYIDSQSFIKKPTLETVNKYIAELKAGNI